MARRIRIFAAVVFVTSVALGTSTDAVACPVCFGQSDGPMAQGVNLAILALLGITVAMLASFAAFFVYLARRAKLARQGSDRWDDEPVGVVVGPRL